MFIFFPLLISIILAMGYDKVTAALTTFGAMLVVTQLVIIQQEQ